MIREISVKGIKIPELLVERVLNKMKEGMLIIEAEDWQIDKIKDVAKKYNYKVNVEGNKIIIHIGKIAANRTINVVGATCPGPIMMVSDVLEKMNVGEVLEIIAGKNALTDLTEGLKGAGHEVLSIEELEDGNYRILIKKGEKKVEGVTTITIDELFIINTTGTGNAEKAYATFLMADVAKKMNLKPTIFLMMDGASLALKGECDKVKHPDFPKLGDLVRKAIKEGVKVYVCELSAKFRGINEENLEEGFEIAGAPTFLNYLSKPNVRPVWL
ncbi:DsrE family protein [Methanocaldococcus villosus KIN24-T80]|uniref:DsrE family protein n=1 Tax=Methanocaldococcus villosus KIN24-T80 TaxID=1069083 RepID=N6UVH5_9EURY|nr:DsrE family protein [Methanocaldococcus villosus]ENN96354.1 DsrE family protein [Methanocaldococcus villosus KIN24-T80]